MKNMYKLNADELASCTVRPEDVSAVELELGEIIYVRGRPVEFGSRTVCIVDRFSCYDMSCTMIRQALECPDDEWGQECIWPSRNVRAWANAHGYPTVTVPGGIRPLVREGTVAVPDYNMSGTTWYLVPETALAASGLEFAYREDTEPPRRLE